MRIAVYPGGFDPVTNGHMDIVRRMTHLFDRVIVAVVQGREKSTMFTWEERIELIRKAVEDLPSVEVEGFSGMTVEYARQKGAVALVRGMNGGPAAAQGHVRNLLGGEWQWQADGCTRYFEATRVLLDRRAGALSAE